jgi:hypothetical protein
MLKFKVTNIGKQPKFLVEAGKLLRPGESTPLNRIEASTRNDKVNFRVEEGDFPQATPPAKTQVGPQTYDDDDDDDDDVLPKKPAVEEEGEAQLVDSKSTKRSVPLPAVGELEGDDGSDPDDDGQDLAKDELDELVAKAAPLESTKDEVAGFVTRTGSSSTNSGKGGDENGR